MISYDICLWLISLKMIISRSIHVAANGIISFFLRLSGISIVYIYVPHLYPFICCFHVLAIVNSAAVSIICIYLFELYFCPDICPGVRLLGYMIILFLVFWGNFIWFSIVVVPIFIPSNSVGGFPFLHTLSSICYLVHFFMRAILTGVRWYFIVVWLTFF